ncbi:MAG: hypothetical protein HKP62_05520 [Sulfurovum sp.]|nr:hypothetical protein [Sulfurovum sp.]NNJ45455.1 hypothetical protein [Sulfurovum sp.]
MNRRRQEYDNLVKAIESEELEQCPYFCFKMLYGLSPELHFHLVYSKMNGYLSVLENRFPEVTWPRKLLDNPKGYVDKHGRQIPDSPEGLNIDDEMFLFCFHAIALAYTYIDSYAIVSTSFVCALENSIRALGLNAWIEKKPIEHQAFMKTSDDNKRKYLDNAISIDVEKQEWQDVASWLKKKGLLEMPDDVDVEKMEAVLKYWENGEFSLIVPKTRELLEQGRDDLEINIFDIL